MQHPSIEKAFIDADYNLQAGNPHRAAESANKVLLSKPDDPDALYMAAVSLSHIGLYAIAASVLRQCVALRPEFWQAWNNLGNCFQEQHPYQALAFYRKAIDASKGEAWEPLANAANASTGCGRYAEAVDLAQKALAINPVGQDAHNAMGLARLHRGEWKEGWKSYSRSYGNKWRRQRDYTQSGETPLWVPNATGAGHVIVLHGEQGPGDEAMFSMLMLRAVHKARSAGASVVIECHPQMLRIFEATFGALDGVVGIYGTRLEDAVAWAAREHKVTHKLPFGSLPMHFLDYERDSAPFHNIGGFGLNIPSTDRDMARAYIQNKMQPNAKMTCGIAWNGGSVETGWRQRSLTVEEVVWLCEQCPNVDFYDLEYQDPRPAFKDTHVPSNLHFTHIHQHNKDLALVAGFVSELDHLASVTTTVVDLAGAQGQTRTTVLAPKKGDWRYSESAGDGKMYWYDNVSVIRQKDEKTWKPELKELAEKLNAMASLRG